ncbi:alpha/beta hydrolase [Mycobacterium sp.]|uniref:alpha/beta hydrolase n=1 Tax=Mycobacterium sp. TaxID=1785 RepID=UPI003C711353
MGIVTVVQLVLGPHQARAEYLVANTTTAVGCANLPYPVATAWYFPSAAPLGLVWLQHGFVEDKQDWSAFAPMLANRGYLVMATTLATVNLFSCTVENLGNNTGFLDNIADVFAHKDDPNGALATSFSKAAAKVGAPVTPLPDRLVFVGHSAGVEAVEYVANRLRSTYPATFAQMRGIVSEDGVKSFIGSNTQDALTGLAGTALPIYATASPRFLCNDFQSGTKAIEQYLSNRPFLGVKITTGAHGDVLGPSSPAYENLVCTCPRQGNVAAVWGLTQGWITDMFAGTITPDFYPGGSYYTTLLTAGTITTLP